MPPRKKTTRTAPKKRPPRQASPRRAARRRQTNFGNPLPWVLGVVLLVMLLATLATTGYFIFLRPAPPAILPDKSVPPGRVLVPEAVKKEAAITADEEFHPDLLQTIPTEPAPSVEPVVPVIPAVTDVSMPKVAIIIDDMGYRHQVAAQLIDLDLELSFSFLPGGPHTSEELEAARGRGRDTLLHLPLEPTGDKWDPGPGALFLKMDRTRTREVFLNDLAAVPGVVGVNNHMGSRFTEERQAMRFVLQEIKDKGLFFVDSVTSSKSVAGELARSMGIRTASRQVFLDNIQERSAITGQLQSLVQLAEKHGQAVGIGHPYPETLATLVVFRGELARRARLVPVSRLVR